MTDIIGPPGHFSGGRRNNELPRRYKDVQGDGTEYAEQLGVTVSIPPVTVDPTGLATAAKQDTGNTSLAAIATNTGPNAIGAQGNLWNAAAALAGASSTSLQLPKQTRLAVFGNADAPTTITLRYSADNSAYYPVVAVIPDGDGNFAITGLEPPAGVWVALQTSAAATITATALAST